MLTTEIPRENQEPEVSAYKETDQEALRAFHLDRVVSKFSMIISADNAELLAGLLGGNEGDQGSAA